ncbi:sodium- and chloride-dependent glycine transporter 1-like [Physella acuta]|uniref:sodium- and chloride-dependent glycine transporter 1-like n=1 Tax=Physella acuta TaxID=109671 RepID=UPI0027DB66CC|nr:sodium- and chloride-dependent glycine transporter 1-like [Physella acuta]
MSRKDLEIVKIEEISGYRSNSSVNEFRDDISSSEESKDGEYSVGGDYSSRDSIGSAVLQDGVEFAPGDPDRGSWSGKFDFLMSCVGYAVGLGNVWRFPYLCYKNGGGAFLIPYTLMLIGVGLPLFFMELAFGQFASLGPITIWRINPLFKGLGYAMVIVSWLISLYYNVVIAQILFYLFASFTDALPWTSCGNSWNTDACLVHDLNQTFINETKNSTGVNFNLTSFNSTASSLHKVSNTPAEEYYRYYVLQQSESIEELGSINWKLAGCLCFAWVIVGAALIKGVQSLGKVVYFTALFPYIMLTVLLVRGLTLDGATDGIIYYLKPDFQKLADPRVWNDAATQIFYSLSACSGGLIAMSSFNKFTNNCHRDAILVAVINCSTSIFAGFVIFSILGFMAHEKGVDVADVAKGGPGLVFEVYPEALSRMVVAPMWSIFFFIMMATLGFGSQFSIVECVISAALDEFVWLKKTALRASGFRVFMIILALLLGLPLVCSGGMQLLTLVDSSVSGFPLLFVGLIECVAINWVYGFNNFWSDIQMMVGKKSKIYWKVTWLVVSPIVLLLTILVNIIFYTEPSYNGQLYPAWAQSLGWLICAFPLSAIAAWFLYYYCKNGGLELLKMHSKPLPQWGPALADNRTENYSAEIQSQKNIATLQNYLGNHNDRSQVHLGQFVKLLASSSSTINTIMTQSTEAGSFLHRSSTVSSMNQES